MSKEDSLPSDNKTYLGDGVYADCDGYHIILTTEDGIRVTNTIFLDPHVARLLTSYIQKMMGGTHE